MTDAPERIWAWPSGDGRGWYAAGASNEPTMAFDDVPYTLAASVEARLAAAERMAAALREIADNPCIDPEGNSAEARAALTEWEAAKGERG